MCSHSLLLSSCLLLACSGAASDRELDAALPDAGCGDGLSCAPWIQGYEREVLAKISGHEPMADGWTLFSRFSLAERSTTRDYIENELTRFGLQPERHDYGSGINLVARLPATVAGASLVLLGCHYDGVEGSPAAGDDGTGVALVLAAARYFQSQELRQNDMIFAFFDEEEKGLIGSQAYANKLRAEEPDLAAAHIYDLISWDADGDGAVELWSPSTELEALYRSVAGELAIEVHAVEFDASDHASFIGNGFSTLGVSEEFVSGDFNPNYHTADDSYENVDFAYLERISRLAFEVNSRAQ